MNDRTEQQLLADVMAESSPPDFRAGLLEETLQLARRRRQRRQLLRAGGIISVATVAGFFAWQNRTVKMVAIRPAKEIASPKSCQLVETHPLAAENVVTTKSIAGPKSISSSAAVVEVASTSGGFKFINDEQLLALAGSRPAMLIRTGPNSEELVFADAEPPADSPGGRRAN